MAVEHRILFILWFILKAQLIYNKTKVSFVGKKKLPSKKFMVASLSLKLWPEITKHMIEMSMLAPAVVEGTTSEKAWQQGVEDCISKVWPWPHALQIVWKCLHIGTHEIFFFWMFKHGFLTTNRIVIIKVGSIIEKDLSSGFTVCLKVFTIVELLSLSLLRRT